MINFNIPGLYTHSELNIWFLQHYINNREWFRDDVKIQSVFGNFPYCTWDGGRNFPHYRQATKNEIINIKEQYNFFGANSRFIFTNPMLTEQDLDDRFNNLVLKLCEDDHAEVVINSDLVKNYIQQNYPKYKLISSTTKCITNKEKALEEIHNSEYYQICLDYNLNKDIEFLESIPKEDRHKVEFLVNAICAPKCPFRKQHYAETGKSHLTYLKYQYTVLPWCSINQDVNHPTVLGQGNNLTNEDIEKYHKMGFQHFKLEGRTLSGYSTFANYLYYMIKPEYYFIAIKEIGDEIILELDNNNMHIFEYKGEKRSPIVSPE